MQNSFITYKNKQIEATSSRLKMIEILANFIRTVAILSPDDLLCSVYLCLNQLAPAYVGNAGYKLLKQKFKYIKQII